jgi:hypothetical protein
MRLVAFAFRGCYEEPAPGTLVSQYPVVTIDTDTALSALCLVVAIGGDNGIHQTVKHKLVVDTLSVGKIPSALAFDTVFT